MTACALPPTLEAVGDGRFIFGISAGPDAHVAIELVHAEVVELGEVLAQALTDPAGGTVDVDIDALLGVAVDDHGLTVQVQAGCVSVLVVLPVAVAGQLLFLCAQAVER